MTNEIEPLRALVAAVAAREDGAAAALWTAIHDALAQAKQRGREEAAKIVRHELIEMFGHGNINPVALDAAIRRAGGEQP